MFVVLALSLVLPAPSAGLVADARAEAALARFLSSWGRVRTLTYRLDKQERLRGGELRHEVVDVKVQKPSSYYIAAKKPNQGQEVIYVGTRDADHLVVHPGSFPDVTLRLDVHGSLATKNQRHVVYHSGFQYTVDAITQALEMARRMPHGERLEYVRQDTFVGRQVEVVRLHAGSRPAQRVRAREDETLFAFARRVGQDAYVIFSANPSIDELSDTLEADEYVVPVYYAAVMELWLDRDDGLPRRQLTLDGKGAVLERYDFESLVVDPALGSSAFDPENPAYGF